jgi:putative PIN family toxin of toxin-antitoxin system
MKSKPPSSRPSRNPAGVRETARSRYECSRQRRPVRSKPKQLLDLAADGHIDLAISEAILEETLRVLRDKFHHTPEELGETAEQLRVIARTVTPTESIAAVDADASDNRILECAVAADAEIIVSGDNHLLALGSFSGIQIQRVGEFLAAFQ